jgi:hypothetical protein
MTLDALLQIQQTLLPKTTYAEFKTLFTLSTRYSLPMHPLALKTDVGIYSQLCPLLCCFGKYNLKLELQIPTYTTQTEHLWLSKLQKYTLMKRTQRHKIATEGSTIRCRLKSNVISDYTLPLLPSQIRCHGLQFGASKTELASTTLHSICPTKTSVLLFMVSHCWWWQAVFSDMKPCSLVIYYRYFVGACCPHLLDSTRKQIALSTLRMMFRVRHQ